MSRFRNAALLLTFSAALYAADYMPLTPGNTWTYRDSVTGGSFTVEVGATQVMLNDHVYHSLTGFTPGKLLVRINEFGNLVYWDSDLGQDLFSLRSKSRQAMSS